jgi:hypothetical protein
MKNAVDPLYRKGMANMFFICQPVTSSDSTVWFPFIPYIASTEPCHLNMHQGINTLRMINAIIILKE